MTLTQGCLVCLALGVFAVYVGHACAEDLRTVPGCHPVFACPPVDEDEPADPPSTPVLPQAPLFTPELVARDTRPEMLALLNRRTLANAEAFVAKEREGLQAVYEAQQLIDQVKARGRKP